MWTRAIWLAAEPGWDDLANTTWDTLQHLYFSRWSKTNQDGALKTLGDKGQAPAWAVTLLQGDPQTFTLPGQNSC